MKVVTSRWKFVLPLILSFGVLVYASCSKSDDNTTPQYRSKEYPLTAVGNSHITGKVTISENADSSFNVLVALDSSVKDTVHITSLLNGSTSSPGIVALPLTNITGTGGAASGTTTNIKMITFPENTTGIITYDSILNFKGFVNVYYSANKKDSIIAHGNIGSN